MPKPLELPDLGEMMLFAVAAQQDGHPQVRVDTTAILELLESASLLAKLRAHKHFNVFVCALEVDREEWACSEGTDGEDYPGEALERIAVYDAAIHLLTGKPYRRQTHLRLVESDHE
jgi:hypothetical protein